MNSNYLSKRGYVIRKEVLSTEELSLLKSELTVIPLKDTKYNSFNQHSDTFHIYIETKNKIYIPKMYGIKRYGIPNKEMPNYLGKPWEDTQIHFTGTLFENQKEPVQALLNALYQNGGGILKAMTGAGKCMALNTPILMYDGTIKMIQDIKKSELIMGDDSTPRKILSVTSGEDNMYTIYENTRVTRSENTNVDNITQNERDNNVFERTNKYTVNSEHILCLKSSVTKEIIEIPVKKYLLLPKEIKETLKGYRVPIYFQKIKTIIDPFKFGTLIGNGFAKSKIRIKEIPKEYKSNSVETRLFILSGIIKTIGYIYTYQNDLGNLCNQFIIKIPNDKINFKNDVLFICRSLGICCREFYDNKYSFINIFGVHSIFECLQYNSVQLTDLSNLKTLPNFDELVQLIKDNGNLNSSLEYNISVEHIGRDNYYGFTIDGNNRYVLSDFTVTHNTFMTINVLSQLKQKTIVVVNKIPLMKQWESELTRFLPGIKIGFIQGQKNVVVEDCDIVIGMLQSLARIDYPDTLFQDFGAVVVDECFPYDTRIVTYNGHINIGQLYYMKKRSEKLPMVKTFNETTKQFEYKNIINVFRKQNDNLIQIHCSKMKMTSTENHKYLTYNGWKRAKELTVNDYIISNYDKNTINSVCPALNDDQYQIVLGSFLGDGHIQLLKNGRYRLRMTHCKKQYDYCKWKANMFNVNNIRYIEKNGYCQKEAYQFSTKTFYLFNSLPTTKIDVPQWILNDLDERGLAIWFMDDGSLSKKNFYSTISTDSFNEDSQKRIVLKLKSMNIDCKYKMYKKSYFHIIINENGTKQLIRIISKYIHSNMLYKLLPQKYIDYSQDMSIKILDENAIFCSKQNIKKEFLNENQIYKIYKNDSKKDIYYTKYAYCKKCNNMTFHHKNITYKYEYWKCNHTSKDILLDLPIIFGDYNWNSKFLDYGYSKITKITTNIKNFSESKLKRNYVFDLEIEDNHNYIVKKGKDNNENGFVVHNCHNTSSKVFSKVLSKLCCKYTIGLSATPKRSDGCEYVFKYHIGDIVYESNVARKGLDPIIQSIIINTTDYKEIVNVNKVTGQSQIQFTSMLSELILMEKRNKLIIELLKDLVIKNNRKVLVLSDRREHLKKLKVLLDNDTDISFTYGLFLGQMKQADLEKSRASNVILATFSAFGEGVSERDLDTLLLVTPKKFIGHLKNTVKNESGKLEQIVGRIFRKDHLLKNPLIIDLQDNFSVYKSQSSQRNIFYKQHFPKGIFQKVSIDLDQYTLEQLNVNCLISKTKSKNIQNELQQNLKDLQITNCVIDD